MNEDKDMTIREGLDEIALAMTRLEATSAFELLSHLRHETSVWAARPPLEARPDNPWDGLKSMFTDEERKRLHEMTIAGFQRLDAREKAADAP